MTDHFPVLNRFWRTILLPLATLSRAGQFVFGPGFQPPLTGARPPGGAPAYEAFLHPSVHQRAPFRLSIAPLFNYIFPLTYSKPRPISIIFRVPFRLTKTDNLKLISLILETCEKHQIYNVVVDIRGFLGQPGITSDYQLASFSATEALGKVRKAAVIHDKATKEFTSFFETAIRNRGIDLLAFIDKDKAIEWVLV